jgi:arabinogalactan endo-1,4-beta-galactosidase
MNKLKTIPKNTSNKKLLTFKWVLVFIVLFYHSTFSQEGIVNWNTDGSVTISQGTVYFTSRINYTDGSANNGMVKMDINNILHTLDRSQLTGSISASSLVSSSLVKLEVFGFIPDDSILPFTSNFYYGLKLKETSSVGGEPWDYQIDRKKKGSIFSIKSNNIRQLLQVGKLYNENWIPFGDFFPTSLSGSVPIPKQSVLLRMSITNATVSGVTIPGVGYKRMDELFKSVKRDVGLSERMRVSVNDGPMITLREFSSQSLLVGDEVSFYAVDKVKIIGLPSTWVARSAGEVIYYSIDNSSPGAFRPYLGFDSQVHGTAIRSFPEGFNIQEDDWEDYSLAQYGTNYVWKYKIQRPTTSDPSFVWTEYTPQVNWMKEKPNMNYIRPDGKPYKGPQRNNQREGLNMSLLHTWWGRENWNKPPSSDQYPYEGTYKSSNDKYSLFLDDDEFLLVNSQYYNTNEIVVNKDGDSKPILDENGSLELKLGQPMEGHIPDLILSDDIVRWKTVPEGEQQDCILELASAFAQNHGSTRHFTGHEIEDNNLYYSTTSQIPGDVCKGDSNCIYRPFDGAGIPQEVKEASRITIASKDEAFDFTMNVASPFNTNSFYTRIIGTQWPAIYEKAVPYTLIGLNELNNKVSINDFKLVYEYEDHLGILKRDVRSLTQDKIVNGKWTEYFDIQGWGYHNITAYYKDVPVAGKELLEIDMRFLGVPAQSGSENCASCNLPGIQLNEDRGEGEYWFVTDYNDTSPYQIPLFGVKDKKYVREYTFSISDQVTFAANDADPLTFWSYKTDYYLSNRTLAKRIPNDSLEAKKYLVWTLSPISYFGYRNKEGYAVGKPIVEAYGRYHTFTFSTPGTYELKATYRGQSFIAHIIHVVDYNYHLTDDKANQEYIRSTKTKGTIEIYDLSPDQVSWLEIPSSQSSKWQIASVEKVLSKWKYIKDHGPRTPTIYSMDERFEAFNNYQDQYIWYGNDANEITNLNLNQFVQKYETDRLKWFPKNWLRHKGAVKKRKDGTIDNVPVGMDPNLIKDALHVNFNDYEDKLSLLFQNAPESWQFRAPWIAYTTYSGYKTRSNIKALYRMEKFFDLNEGAFAGKGNVKYKDNLAKYYNDVANALPSMTDEDKAKYQFYLDLLTGRKIVFYADSIKFLTVTNVNPENLLPGNNIANGKYNGNYFIAHSKTKTRVSLPDDEFLLGADMSDISAMEDNGDKWFLTTNDKRIGKSMDPYTLLKDYTTSNMVRLHVWSNPIYEAGSGKTGPYNFSTIQDVGDQISRAKEKGFKVMLDLMFSDTWANPAQQVIPKQGFEHNSYEELGTRVYSYVYNTLVHLAEKNLYPDYISLGNETATNMLMPQKLKDYLENVNDPNSQLKAIYQNDSKLRKLVGREDPSWVLTIHDLYRINWDRQAIIFNQALNGVHDVNNQRKESCKTMIHLPRLDNALWFLREATDVNAPNRVGKGILNLDKVDALGCSFYEMYTNSDRITLDKGPIGIQTYIEAIKEDYGLDVVIVETSFPYTLIDADQAENIVTTKHVMELYKDYCQYNPATKQMECTPISVNLQYERMKNVVDLVRSSKGGKGVLYYSPFEKGTNTSFLNSKGSVNDNQGFFKDDVILADGAAKAFGFSSTNLIQSHDITSPLSVISGVNYTIKTVTPGIKFGYANEGSGYTIDEVFLNGELYFTPLHTTNEYYFNGKQYVTHKFEDSNYDSYIVVGSETKIAEYQSSITAKANYQNLGRIFTVRSGDNLSSSKNFQALKVWPFQHLKSDKLIFGRASGSTSGVEISIDGPFFLSNQKPMVRQPEEEFKNLKLRNRDKYINDYLISANRGYAEPNETENSLSAIDKAILYGADMIEIDVAKTKDNVLVISYQGYPLGDTNFGTSSIEKFDYTRYIEILQKVGKANWSQAASELSSKGIIDNAVAVTPIYQLTFDSPDNYKNARLRAKDGSAKSEKVATLREVFERSSNFLFIQSLAIDRVFEKGLAYDVYALAQETYNTGHSDALNSILFKAGVNIGVGQLTQTYGEEFMKQIMFSPYYFSNNFNPSPWASYQAVKDKIVKDQWIVPAYELQFKSEYDVELSGYHEMLKIVDLEKNKAWLGVTDAIPINCNHYYFNWYDKNCTNQSGYCPKYDRRSDLEFTLKMGLDYFNTEDLLNTWKYLKK